MIQRIQSVFLLLLALAMVSVVFVPIWSKLDPASGQELVLTATKLTYAHADAGMSVPTNTYAIAALALTSAAIAVFEIFQYRNRFTQLKLGALNFLLIVATLGACFYYSGIGERMLNIKMPGSYEAGFYLPTLALLLNLLANRFIRSDERLVRSADRLR
ncbi:DUF4293 domain-containing protein [Hymenobacter chitinivorans]|uniref:Uncharacterized protein DUF4293 n=1 Tax=Hymenobacter chitinivorans DSM 11115 TaxID=1121954 RepID=A0A2M9ARU5_9BACT|nr:DUF4293 domain-containing protein [Hymenobacter chitinivorans]PJJ48400.1 uncharacterized protein DUF4293 [Hymenobacter chitinivorans DSM 11115]